MNALFKIAFGALILIAAVWYLYTDQYGAWGDFLSVVNGVVPAFVALVGVFVVWLELDELKIQGETKKEKGKK